LSVWARRHSGSAELPPALSPDFLDEHRMSVSFADIHCHFLPGIDDGPRDWSQALAMARMAVADGMTTIIATPHQLGTFSKNHAAEIRQLAAEFQRQLRAEGIPLEVRPGGEIRIQPGLTGKLDADEVLTLGDHHRHVLLELPHEVYIPIEGLIRDLADRQLTIILAHPERNGGLLNDPDLVAPLVDAGCLMQLTAGSLCGIHGSHAQQLGEWILAEGLAHFIATDAHDTRARRPLFSQAFERAAELADERTARDLCSRNPFRVASGRSVSHGRRTLVRERWGKWWNRRASA
jgi:protein-tyrosine phosphatase